MLYGTTTIPTDFVLEKRAVLEKEALLPLAVLPLVAKLGMGALTAHGLYSGAKDITKGNYGSGLFNLATSIPFIGYAGKGLKAGGMLARMAARGGRVGNLANRMGKGLKGYEAIGQAANAAPKGMLGRAGSWMGNKAVKGYEWLGKGMASKPMGQMSNWWQPIGKKFDAAAKGMNRYGNKIENLGKSIGGTRYGNFMGGWKGMGVMMGAPIAYQAVTGGAGPNMHPAQYANPVRSAASQIGHRVPQGMPQMPQGFNQQAPTPSRRYFS